MKFFYLILLFISFGLEAFPALEFEEKVVKQATRSPASMKTLTFKTYVIDSLNFDPCQASSEERKKAFEKAGIAPKYEGQVVNCMPVTFQNQNLLVKGKKKANRGLAKSNDNVLKLDFSKLPLVTSSSTKDVAENIKKTIKLAIAEDLKPHKIDKLVQHLYGDYLGDLYHKNHEFAKNLREGLVREAELKRAEGVSGWWDKKNTKDMTNLLDIEERKELNLDKYETRKNIQISQDNLKGILEEFDLEKADKEALEKLISKGQEQIQELDNLGDKFPLKEIRSGILEGESFIVDVNRRSYGLFRNLIQKEISNLDEAFSKTSVVNQSRRKNLLSQIRILKVSQNFLNSRNYSTEEFRPISHASIEQELRQAKALRNTPVIKTGVTANVESPRVSSRGFQFLDHPRKAAGVILGAGAAYVAGHMIWMEEADAAYTTDVNLEALNQTGLEVGEVQVEVPEGKEFSGILTLKKRRWKSRSGCYASPRR